MTGWVAFVLGIITAVVSPILFLLGFYVVNRKKILEKQRHKATMIQTRNELLLQLRERVEVENRLLMFANMKTNLSYEQKLEVAKELDLLADGNTALRDAISKIEMELEQNS